MVDWDSIAVHKKLFLNNLISVFKNGVLTFLNWRLRSNPLISSCLVHVFHTLR